MPLTRRTTDRIASSVFLVLCALLPVAAVVSLWPLIGGAFTSPSDIHVADPALAVRDARALVADRNAHPEKYAPWIRPENLPRSLRIRNLRFAKIHQDHVDLVIARNPDWNVGARIWSERHRPHRDRRTRYPGIFFFRYSNDDPESPDNIP